MQTKENNHRTQFSLLGEGKRNTFTTVVAEPKAGKTSLAVSLTLEAIFNGNRRVLFVNGQGGNGRELLVRVMCILEDISLKDFFTSKKNVNYPPYIGQFSELADRQQFFFTRGPENDLLYFLRAIRNFVKEQAIDCVIFDDFHQVESPFEEERKAQLLLELSQELQIPIWVFLPQLAKKTTQETALYNTLSKRSDWVIQLHRPTLATRACLQVVKHPYDETPVNIPLQFSPRTAHFVDLEMMEQHWLNEIGRREYEAMTEVYERKEEPYI